MVAEQREHLSNSIIWASNIRRCGEGLETGRGGGYEFCTDGYIELATGNAASGTKNGN